MPSPLWFVNAYKHDNIDLLDLCSWSNNKRHIVRTGEWSIRDVDDPHTVSITPAKPMWRRLDHSCLTTYFSQEKTWFVVAIFDKGNIKKVKTNVDEINIGGSRLGQKKSEVIVTLPNLYQDSTFCTHTFFGEMTFLCWCKWPSVPLARAGSSHFGISSDGGGMLFCMLISGISRLVLNSIVSVSLRL